MPFTTMSLGSTATSGLVEMPESTSLTQRATETSLLIIGDDEVSEDDVPVGSIVGAVLGSIGEYHLQHLLIEYAHKWY